MPEPLAAIALAELTRRRDRALRAVAERRFTLPQVEARLRPWAAIAAWFHADVSPFLAPEPGVYHATAHPEQGPSEVEGRSRGTCWLDFMPPRQRADDALRAIAAECRRAYVHALGDPDNPARAANLARLDQRLSIAAGLPAWQPEPKAAPDPAAKPAPAPSAQAAA